MRFNFLLFWFDANPLKPTHFQNFKNLLWNTQRLGNLHFLSFDQKKNNLLKKLINYMRGDGLIPFDDKWDKQD